MGLSVDASGRGQIVWESGKRQGRRLFFFLSLSRLGQSRWLVSSRPGRTGWVVGAGGMARVGSGIGDQGRAKSIVAIRCLLLGESNPTQAKKQAGKSMPIRFLFATLYQKKYIVL